MRVSFFLSVFLHLLAAFIMVWASGAHEMKRAPLPQATVVKLIRPMGLPLPLGEPKSSKDNFEEPSSPPMEIPSPKKGKKEKPAKPVEVKKPAPKKDKTPKSNLESLGATGKQLTGTAGTLAVGNGSGGFEYDFYLAVIQSKIEQNFRPPPGMRSQVLTTVSFTIEKNGLISNIRLAKPSGNLLIDQAAERAVRAAGRFPPLPPQYEKGLLDIYFEFAVNTASGR